MKYRCQTCDYYDEGACHRFPPADGGVFPLVAHDQWCGLHSGLYRNELNIRCQGGQMSPDMLKYIPH